MPESDVRPITIGPIGPASTQPTGAVTGRIIFTSAGHGWTWHRTNILNLNGTFSFVDTQPANQPQRFYSGADTVTGSGRFSLLPSEQA